MLTGQINRHIYCGGNTGQIFYSIIENRHFQECDFINELELMPDISKEIIELFERLTLELKRIDTNKIEDSIPDTLAIKNYPCFKDIDWINLENGLIEPPFLPNKVY